MVVIKRVVSIFWLFILFFSAYSLEARVGSVVPGQPLWGVVKREGETVDIIESKICEIDSQLDVIESKVDAIDFDDTSLIEIVESKVCEIDSQLDVIESRVDAIDCGDDTSLIEIVESKICEIDSQLDVIESKVDAIDCGDDTSLIEIVESKVCEIDSQLDVIESRVDAIDCGDDTSLIEIVESKICEIDSQLDVIESKVDAIDFDDTSLIAIIESKVCEIDSQLDVIESKVDSIITATACDPTSITSAGTIGSSGSYCLANAISGSITIAASDVVLDLNNYTVSAGITVNGSLDRVTIKNGAVSGTGDAILVNGDTTGVTISDVTVKNAIRGINFNNVTSGLIKNCEMTLNTTGLELDNSHKIVVRDCIASCNTHAGYDLLSSTTNCFENCKALSTGEGNNEDIENNLFGFVSNNGYGNIFERCIANSTQALSTTDSSSTIAGFGLRGSEGCSKIIDCEAANSTANNTGQTTPYGIWLEPSLETLQTITGSTSGNGALDVQWAPDGKFVAVSGRDLGESTDQLQVYEYDRVNNRFSVIDGVDTPGELNGRSLAWSPDGAYIALIDDTTGNLRIFAFDALNRKLELVATELAASTLGVSWSPDGKFIASVNDGLKIFEFNRVNNAITLITSASIPAVLENDVDWHPSSRFLAVVTSALGTGSCRLYSFDSSAGTLTLLDEVLPSIALESVRWAPNGKHLAAGGGGTLLNVLFFDESTSTLTVIAQALGTVGSVTDVSWAPNGKFIAIGGSGITGGTADQFQVVSFDETNATLTALAGLFPSVAVNDIAWSPDGGFIVLGFFDNSNLLITPALSFPEKNIIKNNVVYCNSNLNEACLRGVSISGSNVTNMINSNVSYNNPFGYEFITNVFDGLSNSIPTILQNINIADSQPPCLTINLASEMRLLKEKMCDIQSKIDAILLAV